MLIQKQGQFCKNVISNKLIELDFSLSPFSVNIGVSNCN